MVKIYKSKAGCILTSMLVCILWGSLYSVIKLGQTAFAIDSDNIPSIMLFAGLRFFISGIVLVILASVSQKKFAVPDKVSIMPIIWVAFVVIVLHYSFTYIALAVGQSSKAAILKQVGFLLLSCFAFVFRKEDKFTYGKLIGGILGFAGVIVVNFNGLEFDFSFGDILVLVASFCSVAGSVISKNAYDKCNPLTVVSYSQLFGGIILTGAGLALGGHITLTASGLWILVYIIASSVIAYSLWNMLVKYNDISLLSVLKFMEPLFAVIIAIFLFPETETFKLEYAVAFVIIAVAVWVSHRKSKKSV